MEFLAGLDEYRRSRNHGAADTKAPIPSTSQPRPKNLTYLDHRNLPKHQPDPSISIDMK